MTYCQYGYFSRKPTDIWTNYPNPHFKPACKNGDPCHIPAPRHSNRGIASLRGFERSVIPEELCEHIVDICEKALTDLEVAI